MSGRPSRAVQALVLALPLTLGLACGDDGAKTADVLGTWFACDDEDCHTLMDDGFELSAGDGLTTLRLESDDPDDVRYCTVPAGSFGFAGGALTLMVDGQEPRTVGFELDEDNDNLATLVDEDGRRLPYLRVDGRSSGDCAGVL